MVLKSYFFDIDRLRRMNEDQLRRYQDRCLRHMVFFAYTVPLYHDTYKDAGVHPSDITKMSLKSCGLVNLEKALK